MDARTQVQAVRIGASTTIAAHLLPRLLYKYWGTVAQCSSSWFSSVTVGNTAAICDAVAAHSLDLGFIEGPAHNRFVETHDWLRDELAIIAGPKAAVIRGSARRGSHGASLTRGLQESLWLLREPGSGTREVADRTLLPHLGEYKRYIELGSSEAIKHCVAAGLGVACLSRMLVEDLVVARRLVVLKPPWPRIHRQFYWVIRKGKTLPEALNTFIADAQKLVGYSVAAG
jgi:DNA-binding transcriptional LysR family regulator